MSKPNETAEKIRAWMLEVLADTGLSPSGWAKKAGLAGTTVSRAIKPDYQFVTSSKTLGKLAEAVNREAPDTRAPRESQLIPKFLAVRYKVQAGLWYEIDACDVDDRGPSRPVTPDPRFADWPQWLEEVVGDSVNLLVPEGGFAHVVDAIEMGYEPKVGDLVVVERRRAQGLLRERTIKQVQRPNGKVELWPRSSNPQWNAPVVLNGGASGDIEVEIVGLVIGYYTSFM